MKKMTWVFLTLALMAGIISGCSNGGRGGLGSLPIVSPSQVPGGSTGNSMYKIASIQIDPPAEGDTTKPLKIFFDQTPPAPPSFIQNCQSNGPCVCAFSWTQDHPSLGSIVRTTQVAFSSASDFTGTCHLPLYYDAEMPMGATISLQVYVGDGNKGTSNVHSWTKTADGEQGNFSDFFGRAFKNIARYSCIETSKKGLKIYNKKEIITRADNQNAKATLLSASEFCFEAVGPNGQMTNYCQESVNKYAGPYFSNQSYYYDLYIPTLNKSQIVGENLGYFCPKVTPKVNPDADFYPFDQQFALATSSAGDFSVEVKAISSLGNSQSNTLVTSTIGYAMKPKSDGSCGTIKRADGLPQPTYRLRRFLASYPAQFNTNGGLIPNQRPATNTIYVLDRPVKDDSGIPKYTMAGPKPCPFAYYDKTGVTDISNRYTGRTAYSGYRATNDVLWNGPTGNGTNVDGLELPNYDLWNESCGATTPLFNPPVEGEPFSKANVTFATSSRYNPVPELQNLWIRPQKAWAPEYLEDQSFEACAPESSTVIDPPLHFVKTPSGQDAYCAESYPTKNRYMGVAEYTSHASRGNLRIQRTTDCGQSETCSSFKTHPLLAQELDVENTLLTDPNYSCRITFDRGQEKSMKRLTPSTGCCINSNIYYRNSTSFPGRGHLEPGDGRCSPPTY